MRREVRGKSLFVLNQSVPPPPSDVLKGRLPLKHDFFLNKKTVATSDGQSLSLQEYLLHKRRVYKSLIKEESAYRKTHGKMLASSKGRVGAL